MNQTDQTTEISPKQKGSILEHRFIELISLGSNGSLTCFSPDSDDDGIDIIVNKKSEFKPLFIQVKSRFKLNANGSYSQDVGTNTFNSDDKFWICFFLYNQETFEVDNIWLVPSKDFEEKSNELNPQNYKQKLRFSASPKELSNDKWSQYKVDKGMLAKRVQEAIDRIY